MDCNDPKAVNEMLVHLRDESIYYPDIFYPQNLLRNIARRSCHTSHSFTIDVDMLIVPDMAESLEIFLDGPHGNCWNCTYIVPVYEIHDDVQFLPKDKETLIELLNKKLARRFHVKVIVYLEVTNA